MAGENFQMQQVSEFWKRAFEDQVSRVEALQAEADRVQAASAEQAKAISSEYARLAADAIAYTTSLQSEWRKLALEATRRAFTFFPGALARAGAAMATPRDTVLRDGPSELFRFRRPRDAARGRGSLPLLLVPSLVNRWHAFDLCPGASLVEALASAGVDTFCLDWGAYEDEDRYLTWHEIVERLGRAARRVRRVTGARSVGLLGYCVGATLSGIYAALHPRDVAALVNIAGAFDFAHAGGLARMADPRWFDTDAFVHAGNVPAWHVQGYLSALRPTAPLAKALAYAERAGDDAAREAFLALEGWANDSVPFPAAAYETYVRDLYQHNQLVLGEHYVGGERVDLGRVRCPVFTAAAERDAVCPPAAAKALNERVGSIDTTMLVVPGGHVGALVGATAKSVLYPVITQWIESKLCNSIN